MEIARLFSEAHDMGLATILWCYLRNNAFKQDGTDYHSSADLTGQANHLGVTLGADIIKQKLPENNFGYKALNQNGSFGKFDEKMYTQLSSDHPIDLTRYQVANNFMGRMGLINSGGASGKDDLAHGREKPPLLTREPEAWGLSVGARPFRSPWQKESPLLNAIQDVYLNREITIA